MTIINSKKPEITVLFNNQRQNKPMLSIILVDWSCRESIHAIDYLNKQSINRDQYEIIWIEYYSRHNADIETVLKKNKKSGHHVIDKWLILNMPDDTLYHKHLMYNAGIAASRGEVVTFCDSDAIFGVNFTKNILESFKQDKDIVLHLDEVSNTDKGFYPFSHPSIDDILTRGSVNWKTAPVDCLATNVCVGTTTGLSDKDDSLHALNYGACMSALRQELINIGGADEHMDYLGYVSGAYEMTFRLLNTGKKEVWHHEEFLYHVWHPGHQGDGNYVGPHDGKLISLRAVENLKTNKVTPFVENEAIKALQTDADLTFDALKDKLINPEYTTSWSYFNVSKSPEFKMLYSSKPFTGKFKKIKERQKSNLTTENVRVWKDPVEICLYDEFHIIKFYDTFYALPIELGKVDFKIDEHHHLPGILKDKDFDNLKKAVDVKGKRIIEEVKLVNQPTLLKAYYGHNIVSYLNRFYAIPHGAGKIDFIGGEHKDHPAVKVADTEQEVVAMIDDATLRVISTYKDHQIIKYGRCFYGLPKSLGYVDLFDARERNRIQMLKAKTQAGLERLINDLGECFLDDDNVQDSYANKQLKDEKQQDGTEATPVDERLKEVEYGGWIPIFKKFGDCGNHPQFRHLETSPDGYKFIYSKNKIDRKQGLVNLWWIRLLKLFRLLLLVIPVLKLFFASLIRGAKLKPIVEFLRNRGIRSQLMVPLSSNLVFLPSVPFTYGQTPWVMEVEDTTSMFFPALHNGRTADLDITACTYYPILKAMLELKSCKGIITHVKSTAESIPLIFKNDELARKITYMPLGVKLPQKFFIKKSFECVNILFTISWHQNAESFFLRGGHDLLEAYQIIQGHYPNVHLILRTSLLSNMDKHYMDIINGCNVRLIDSYLSNKEMQILLDQADIYVLPSARIHVVSILQAMANGLAVVVSDGWGIEEYVVHGYNGIVLKGRYGKVSWIDPQSGMLKEDYSHMFEPDPVIVEGLVGSLSALIENRQFRHQLGRNARNDVENRYNVKNWNDGLKKAFDMALN
ncbi:MAG: glycosyltransferase [Nitrospirae bacterium]|nr:glycosyltransferase [Nitrospirota bacterium]